jgi:choline-sulfatase
MMRVPGVTRRGAVCKAPVSQVALVPTLLDLCGLPPARLDEPSLAPFLRDRSQQQSRPVYSEFTIGGKAEKYLIRSGDWKYSHYTGDTPELYNLREDPDEMNNLATSASHRETAARLHKDLLAWRAR